MKHDETGTQHTRFSTDHPSLSPLSRAIALATLVIISALLIRTISEYDIWFHLTLGREIIHSRSLPLIDTFSLLNQGRTFHNSQWLFQVLAAAGYPSLGAYWLQLLQAGLWGVTFWATYRSARSWASVSSSCLLLLMVALACEERFSIRPELISVAMIALIYWRLQQDRFRTPADMAFLCVLQVIWTNSHGIFVIGPFMAGCYLLVAVCRDISTRDFSESRRLAGLTLLMWGACLITPYGWGSLKFAWQLATQVGPTAPALFRTVYDLRPPFSPSSRAVIAFWFYVALLATACSSLLAMLVHDRRQIPVARLMIVSAMFVLSLTGIRNIPLFAVVCAPLIVELLSLTGSPRLRRLAVSLTTLIIISTMLTWSPRPALNHLVTWLPYRFGLGASSDYVPMGLPAFLERIRFSGPVYNSQNLGGFYEFHGYPRRIPFLDGRFEAYDPLVLGTLSETVFNAYLRPEPWYALAKRFGFQGMLLENGSADSLGLLPLITKDGRWRLVYLDYAASFWLRSDRPDLPPEIDSTAVSGLVEHAQTIAQAENLDIFLDKTSRFQPQRLRLLEGAKQRWNTAYFAKNLGLLQMERGDLAAAEATFKELLSRYPTSLQTLTTLSQIALLRGDKSAAEQYLLQGLALFPNDADLRDNLALIRQSNVTQPPRLP